MQLHLAGSEGGRVIGLEFGRRLAGATRRCSVGGEALGPCLAPCLSQLLPYSLSLPKYTSSGVLPPSAECGITVLCCST
jgi:hypothetical protein